MKFRSQIIIFISCLILFACANVKDLEVKEVKGFKIKEITTAHIDSEIILAINNPNSFGFYIFPSEFDVTYSGVYLGKAKLLKKVKINGATEAAYSFDLKNEYKEMNLMDVMKVMSSGGFKNLIEVKGTLKAGHFLLRKKFKVDYKDEISLD